MTNMWQRIGIALGGLIVLALLGLLVFRMTCLSFVDKHEFGYMFDRFTGQITRIERSGWVVRNPIRYNVHTIDRRPYQITITASLGINQRILNAKLVRFNPDGLNRLIEWHGRGAGDNVEDLKEILKCYAFDKEGGKSCPFLVVVSDIAPSQTAGTDVVK